ncbi:MAG: DMT family transporter [Rhodospirillales bacterium]|jgi:drug/metabolite transporter (DMT)-like permease|nr:DMT family transporter [Rhodospirillales bacterium]
MAAVPTRSNTLKGIACMIGGAAFLTLNDGVMKWMTASYPVGEVIFIRSLFVLIPVALLAWRAGGLTALRVHNIRGQAVRTVLSIASMGLFVTGLRLLPLAEAIALTFASPLFVTALAPPLLGERVGWRRWLAVLLGFAGVLIMIRPGGETMRWVVLLPLGAALTFGLANIVTRRISATESSVSILAVSMFSVTVVSLATAPFGWRAPAMGDVALLALAGLLLGCAHFLMIEAFRLAEAAVASPFHYSAMIWALILDLVLWANQPDPWVMGGAMVVIASGLYILRRETRRRRDPAEPT